MISTKFNNFEQDKSLQNLLDKTIEKIVQDLLNDAKIHITEIIFKQFEPYLFTTMKEK